MSSAHPPTRPAVSRRGRARPASGVLAPGDAEPSQPARTEAVPDALHGDPDRRGPAIRLPRPPAESAPYVFPLLATIAPVVGSLVLWTVTHSPFALVFALVGPLVAVASLADSRIGGRRGRRRERRRFEADVSATHLLIERVQAAEVVHLEHAWPGIRQILDAARAAPAREPRLRAGLPETRSPGPPGEPRPRPGSRKTPGAPDARAGGPPAGHRPTPGRRAPVDLVRWSTGAPTDVVLGRGQTRSATQLAGDAPLDASREQAVTDALARLTESAGMLRDAPVHLDLRPGVGFAGPRRIALAAARACILQLARSLPPAGTVIRIPAGPDWDWMLGLPHRVERAGDRNAAPSRTEVVLFDSDGPAHGGVGTGSGPRRDGPESAGSVTVAVAGRVADLPHACRQVVVLGDGEQAVLGERQRRVPMLPLRPEFASAEEAAHLAAVLQSVAESEGQGRPGARMPTIVRFAALAPRHPGTPSGLTAIVGADHLGPVELDLVADGPHAVVGGATGSGKSELLVTWVLAMAAGLSPQHVNFLLVDFKGGASFAPVAALPHCVGVVTDLDGRSAARALESLSAEVLHRERALAAARVRGIDELPAGELPRLVIVVDEFAAMSRDLPGLHALFVDLAARGRSLGIHLVLATQRPADTLRESILANCPLRISLRVGSTADSLAVIGTPEAAHLARRPEGRALISRAGEAPVPVQVARSTDEDRAAVDSRWPRSPLRRPWCEPLPLVLRLDDLPPVGGPSLGGDAPAAGGLAFGLADLPSEQRQDVAVWHPDTDGHLLVLGGHRSGTSTLLAVLAEQAGRGRSTRVPDDVEGAWDTVAGLVAGLGARGAGSTADARSARPAEHSPTSGRHRGALPDDDRHLVLVDDVDALVGRFGIDHQPAFVDLLVRLLRDGAASGTSVALSTRQVPAMLQPALALCPARLVLRLGSRQEHVLAGIPADRHDERMPPGRGFWRGDVVQVARVPLADRHVSRPSRLLALPPGEATAIVSTAPRGIAALLEARPGVTVVDLAGEGAAAAGTALGGITIGRPREHIAIVGSPDAWQGAWTLLGSMRARVPLVFDGCTLGEFRSLSRSQRLPPPIAVRGASTASGDRHVWVVTPDDRIGRARLPGVADLPPPSALQGDDGAISRHPS